jgi:predicted MFS family arabinose efflux permease
VTEPPAVSSTALRLFVAYRLVSRGYFHLSILFIFLLQAGHSVLSVAAVLASYGLAMAAITPLTPRLVARLGPARALVLGELLKATGLLVLAAGVHDVVVAVLAQVINAAGFGTAMSADAGVLSRIADPASARAVQARTQSLMFIALLASGVAGGALYLVGPRWPVVAGALAALCAALVAGALARQVGAPAAAGPAPAPGPVAAPARKIAPAEIRWMSYYVMTRGFMLGTFIGLLPFLIFSVLHASVLTLTFYLASYSLAAFVTARYANKLLAMAGAPVFAVVTAVVLLAALVIFAVSSAAPVAAAALVLLGAASGCVRPATMSQLTAASQEFRGTPVPGWLLSRMEGEFGICNALVILAGGALISRWSFTAAMIALCASYVIAQILAELYARRKSASSGAGNEPGEDLPAHLLERPSGI